MGSVNDCLPTADRRCREAARVGSRSTLPGASRQQMVCVGNERISVRRLSRVLLAPPARSETIQEGDRTTPVGMEETNGNHPGNQQKVPTDRKDAIMLGSPQHGSSDVLSRLQSLSLRTRVNILLLFIFI